MTPYNPLIDRDLQYVMEKARNENKGRTPLKEARYLEGLADEMCRMSDEEISFIISPDSVIENDDITLIGARIFHGDSPLGEVGVREFFFPVPEGLRDRFPHPEARRFDEIVYEGNIPGYIDDFVLVANQACHMQNDIVRNPTYRIEMVRKSFENAQATGLYDMVEGIAQNNTRQEPLYRHDLWLLKLATHEDNSFERWKHFDQLKKEQGISLD
ncbi:MAG: hypothetical protein R6U32_06690 [Candidatus Woesearchaeota archaeon]